MVETSRLIITPLSYAQLHTYLRANNHFESEMALTDTGRTISAEVKEMVESFTLPMMKLSPENNYLYITFWIVVEKLTNSIVAELGFKGEPNDKGEIEIGYGTMPACRSRGIMTEAIRGMILWAREQEEIKIVRAETNQLNAASIRVLKKNGFVLFDKKEEMLWWKMNVK